MTITSEVSLTNFKFWSGAKDTVAVLTYDQLYQLEEILEDAYPDGMTDTQLNDIFWFEEEWLAEMLGYADFEALEHDNNGDEKVYKVVATHDNLRVAIAQFDDYDDADDYMSDHDYEVVFGGIGFELEIEESWA